MGRTPWSAADAPVGPFWLRRCCSDTGPDRRPPLSTNAYKCMIPRWIAAVAACVRSCHAQLPQNVLHVILYSVLGDPKIVRDLLVARPFTISASTSISRALKIAGSELPPAPPPPTPADKSRPHARRGSPGSARRAAHLWSDRRARRLATRGGCLHRRHRCSER